MFGLFSILNSLVSVIFPIFGSYKSFESYNKVANEIALSNVNIGGFQVPINALLRKPGDSTNGSGNSEESLQRHLISIQKWMVYWIVYASLNVVESVFLLRYIIPMYSLLRFGISVWLVSPMIIGPVGDTVRSNNIIARKKEFEQFLQSGCGLCYYNFIKPWLDGEFKVLGGIDLSKLISPSILGYLNQYELIHYITQYLNLNKSGEDRPESNFFDLVKSKMVDSTGSYLFVNNFFSDKATSEAKDIPLDTDGLTGADSTPVNVLYEEYDVVDKPKVQDNAGNIKSELKMEKRKGWIW
ncbi:uncharacterized protein AC631_00859 [Debaryomyces fabryi]|uniref:Uncharacterized protein n=1 Tax=Debaryomyces fabryi TaxID=58627 RepID=A0A0V1Q4B8_9ASCO|nr:uncharacterized protein AC631_00859 [Debaryomyces fabryi]KSA03374.1 hypothetical protein AC631_00859 [Debaryomyces fabryi]CUM49959.1 unnamed protein product [Debaryomyces fabryi]